MTKMILSLVATIVCATTALAQNTLVAVLSHGDEFKFFYGATALANAVDNAASGDVITLSAGEFQSADIRKGITIRGVGAEAEKSTTISGSFEINIPQSDEKRALIECVSIEARVSSWGTYISGASKTDFLKCILSDRVIFDESSAATSRFVDCSISDLRLDGSSTASFFNCCLTGFINSEESMSSASFNNSILVGNRYSIKMRRSSFVNCVFHSDTNYDGYGIPEETIAMNCLSVGVSFGFNNIPSAIDCYSVDQDETPSVFKTYRSWTDRWGDEWLVPTYPYELTDEAKTLYIGTDGKEVGMYGGQYPYNQTPHYPQITKLNVAKQTTVDNKLSVEIEVSATE